MSGLLANIIVSGVLQLGVIPGHTMALYDHLDEFEHISAAQTIFADYQAEAVIYKHVFISGGFTSYSLPRDEGFDFYPFRADYTMGAGARAGRFEIGWSHGCYHPLGPMLERLPLPHMDSAMDLFYIKVKMGDAK